MILRIIILPLRVYVFATNIYLSELVFILCSYSFLDWPLDVKNESALQYFTEHGNALQHFTIWGKTRIVWKSYMTLKSCGI